MNKKGFTLIEILIVVAIIAILASIVLVGLGPTQESGRDARRLGDLHDVQNALELYYNKCGSYPGGTNCNGSLGSALYAGTNNYYGGLDAVLTGSGLGINALPQDPSTGQAYYYGVSPGLGNPTDYVLAAKLENPKGSSVYTNYTAPNAAAVGDAPAIAGYTAGGTPDTDCTQASGYYCLGF